MNTMLGNGSSLETKKNIISIKSKSFVRISDYINDVFYSCFHLILPVIG